MNIVILGGSGYIGRALLTQWQQKEPNAQFYLVSRSGKGDDGNNVHAVQADVADADALIAKLPETVDYVVNLVGAAFPDKENGKTVRELNVKPAETALLLAKYYQVKVQGFIAGSLGSKEFTAVKAQIADMYRKSGIKTTIVSPTLVYGGGRSDKLAKLVPLFKFLGIFIPKLRPVHVDDVVAELLMEWTK